jgi:diguanylate cyclase (GGDEF)-like protein
MTEQTVYRVLIVDDQPELRVLLRARLQFERDIEVVGEASNGEEAVRLTRLLAPSAVVLDDQMPVMRGAEAIPLMRAAAPGMSILLYTGANGVDLAEEARPDAIVRKGGPLIELVAQLRVLLEMAPFDVMRLELGLLPLRQAITAFDTWTGLNAHILETLERGDKIVGDQLSGASRSELEALMGVYAHIGYSLQEAARAGSDDVSPVVHVFRATGVMARGALLAFNNHRLPGFWRAWGFDVPDDAVTALSLMHDRLMEVLPMSTGEESPANADSENREDGDGSRESAARDEDHHAEERDLDADVRDAVSEKHDAGVLEAQDAGALEAMVAHAAADRADAAIDRLAAAADRKGAAVRDLDADVRDVASQKHDVGALEDSNVGALEDMVAHAAADREDAAVDRVAAAANREGAAADRETASIDELTGAHRRGAGLVELEREISRSRRTGEPLVVAYVDVDHLKTVNDTDGHEAGDRLLCELVRVLRLHFREYDLIVRLGGDEFLCAFPGQSIHAVSERFSAIRAELLALPDHVSISVGLAEVGVDETLEDLIARADAALYRERAQRRSPVTHPRSGHT